MDVRDGEEVFEDALKADVLALLRGGVGLEERLERSHLDVEQVGHAHALIELCERDFFNRLSHDSPAGTRWQAKRAPTPTACVFRRGRGAEQRNRSELCDEQ